MYKTNSQHYLIHGFRYMMADSFNQDFHGPSSDSDVQEIELPVFAQHRKHHQRLLREPIDRRFWRCSPRKKKKAMTTVPTI
jgi:hypothetical protein